MIDWWSNASCFCTGLLWRRQRQRRTGQSPTTTIAANSCTYTRQQRLWWWRLLWEFGGVSPRWLRSGSLLKQYTPAADMLSAAVAGTSAAAGLPPAHPAASCQQLAVRYGRRRTDAVVLLLRQHHGVRVGAGRHRLPLQVSHRDNLCGDTAVYVYFSWYSHYERRLAPPIQP
jgi:hypothetical protein